MSRKDRFVTGQAACFVGACALLGGWNLRSIIASGLLGLGVIVYDEAYQP